MGGQGKIFCEIDGVPLVIHTLLALDQCAEIDEIILVARPDDIIPLSECCRNFGVTKLTQIVTGGASRTESVLNGLMAMSGKAGLAAIHDGARPLVSPELVSRVVHLAAHAGAAAPAVPPKDTVKKADGSRVLTTLPRDSLMLVQTPQVFDTDLIKGALTMALREAWALTDDCGAVERMGMSVMLSPGEYENIKVTTPEDLLVVEALLCRTWG